LTKSSRKFLRALDEDRVFSIGLREPGPRNMSAFAAGEVKIRRRKGDLLFIEHYHLPRFHPETLQVAETVIRRDASRLRLEPG